MISILFLKYIWLDDVDIWTFHFLMWVFIFFLEIPTWSFADKYSYKLSINLSFFFLSLAFLSFVLAVFLGKFVIFYLTAVCFSLSSSFASGAQNSYIFNIFKYENKLDKYLKFKSKLSKNSKITEWIAILIWAYLYDYLEYLPYLIQFFLVFWAFILSLFLKIEPKSLEDKNEMWNIKNSLKIFFSKKFFLLFLIFITLAVIPFEYFHHVINQSIFEELWFWVKEIWFLWVSSYVLWWFLIHFAPKIWEKLWEIKSYIFLILINICIWILFLLSKNYFYVIFLTSLIYFTRETKNVFLDNSLQFRIKNDSKRATLLSIFNMLWNLPIKFMFIIFWLIFAWFSYVNILVILYIMFSLLAISFLMIFLKNEMKD
jgi:hypothetical protein